MGPASTVKVISASRVAWSTTTSRFTAGQRVALLAELGERAVLGGQDGSGVGRIAGGEAELAHVDRRQDWGPGPRMAMPPILKRGPVSMVSEKASWFGVGMRVDGVEGGGLVDRMVVDRRGRHGVVEAARAQRAIDLGQHGLRALQQGEAVALERLLLLEGLDELLEVIAHALVPRDGKDDPAPSAPRAPAQRTANAANTKPANRHTPGRHRVANSLRLTTMAATINALPSNGMHDQVVCIVRTLPLLQTHSICSFDAS